mmetsp:Transcript_11532/g.43249  ORF Transcript_11532/g.43249 Transcript_11532/m.43249 type:complete len:133 (+) Transcript_11532:880-1278(+)
MRVPMRKLFLILQLLRTHTLQILRKKRTRMKMTKVVLRHPLYQIRPRIELIQLRESVDESESILRIHLEHSLSHPCTSTVHFSNVLYIIYVNVLIMLHNPPNGLTVHDMIGVCLKSTEFFSYLDCSFHTSDL